MKILPLPLPTEITNDHYSAVMENALSILFTCSKVESSYVGMCHCVDTAIYRTFELKEYSEQFLIIYSILWSEIRPRLNWYKPYMYQLFWWELDHKGYNNRQFVLNKVKESFDRKVSIFEKCIWLLKLKLNLI